MQNFSMDNKNIIDCKCIIDENYRIISADEELFRFIGPTVRIFTDSVHQVDVDDFVYTIDRLNEFDVRNMVVRVRRFDNTYRWVLLQVHSVNVNLGDCRHINLELSDIINLNNHYKALTKEENKDVVSVKFNDLPQAQIIYDYASIEMNNEVEQQVNLICFSVDHHEFILHNYGESFYQQMLDDIAQELISFVGDRGKVGRIDGNRFLVMLKNVGNESNLRSFVESSRSKIKWMYFSKNADLNISFTISIAESPRNGKDIDILKKKLKKAYDIAQNKGGNCYIIYKEELHGEI